MRPFPPRPAVGRIEVMIVVVIITLLAAISVGVFSHLRGDAMRTR